jgi:protein tyrosine/serine phosphatase
MKPSIYWIPGPWAGRLAILARPRGNDWLSDEVVGWHDAGVRVVVSLLTQTEESELGLEEESHLLDASRLRFINFPIEDYGVPSSIKALRVLIDELEELLNQGYNVGIHCRAGIGRSSLVAACLLVNRGQDVNGSFQQITNSRGVAVPDTIAQRDWVGDFARVCLNAGC